MPKQYSSTTARDVYDMILGAPAGLTNGELTSALGLGEQTVRQITCNLRSLGLIAVESTGIPGRQGCFGRCRPTQARILETANVE